MNPMSYSDRQAIHHENRRAILRFLSFERAVNLDVLAIVIERHPNQTGRILKAMEKDKLVHTAMVDFWGTKRAVWGLAPSGVAMATTLVSPNENPDKIEVFKPSNMTPTSANHRRGIQLIRATHLTSTDYLHSNLGGFEVKTWGKSKPDLLWQHKGLWYAVEYEATVKSLRRYVDIVSTYWEATVKQPKKLGGVIFCAQLQDISGMRNQLSKAAKFERIVNPPIWTCVAGQPLDSLERIECRMHEVEDKAEPTEEIFKVGDRFYFEGDYDGTESEWDYRGQGMYRLVGFQEEYLLGMAEDTYQIYIRTRESGYQTLGFLPSEVMKK